MKIVHGNDLKAEVENIVQGATKQLILITPYFEAWERLTMLVRNAIVSRGVTVLLVLRGGKDEDKQKEKARAWHELGVRVAFKERLHAKIYMNERSAMVTSLNLLQSSVMSSWEVAVMLDSVQDRDGWIQLQSSANALAKELKEEIDVKRKVAEAAGNQLFTVAMESVAAAAQATITAPRSSRPKAAPPRGSAPKARVTSARSKDPEGHCIRCGTGLPLDPAKPLCRGCYREWAKVKDESAPEKVCHGCGKAKKVSLVKPLCRPCWGRLSE